MCVLLTDDTVKAGLCFWLKLKSLKGLFWLGFREYADFRVTSDGEVQGVGLLIAADPGSGKLVVLAPIEGGPADRAGILPGDEVCFLTWHLVFRSTMITHFKMGIGYLPWCKPQTNRWALDLSHARFNFADLRLTAVKFSASGKSKETGFAV